MDRFLLASAALLAAAACSSSATTTSSPAPGAGEGTEPEPGAETPAEEDPAATEPVAFTDSQVQDLFNMKCVRCHAGATTVLDLRSFKSTTINVPVSKSGTADCADSKTQTRIVPGDRDASLLWHKVKGTQDCGDPMPPPSKGTKLTATELERLGLYIDALPATE
jgi:hypothetical protein